jgi:hypothetical protein
VTYQKKREGWNRALKKYLAANPPTPSLRPLELPIETRLEMAHNQARRIVPTLVGREFDLLRVWEEKSGKCVCMCACGRVVEEVSAPQLLNGNATDCGHRKKEAQRIRRHRKAQKTKQRAKEARAERKRMLAVLKSRKRKPARKLWKSFGLAA